MIAVCPLVSTSTARRVAQRGATLARARVWRDEWTRVDKARGLDERALPAAAALAIALDAPDHDREEAA